MKVDQDTSGWGLWSAIWADGRLLRGDSKPGRQCLTDLYFGWHQLRLGNLHPGYLMGGPPRRPGHRAVDCGYLRGNQKAEPKAIATGRGWRSVGGYLSLDPTSGRDVVLTTSNG